jgi:hypothetical protein
MVQLPKPLYESLPLLYVFAGLAALAAGYVLHSGALSTVLSVAGLLAMVGGAVLWLRRRVFRATRGEHDGNIPE